MWCYVGDERTAIFRHAPTGRGEGGQWGFPEGRSGYIQADAATVFDRRYNGKVGEAIEVGCWAHARRKLHALLESDPRVAQPLKLIGEMSKVEKNATARGLDREARQRERQRRTAPLLARLQAWLARTYDREPPKSALAKACGYSLRHWTALARFLDDGRLRLDNNHCERQIRDVAVGRKNYLFAGSDAGGERAAILYSLMRTCDLNGVEPAGYLEDILMKIADGWPHARLNELLPGRRAAKQAP